MSELSTVAIKDGHRGHNPHGNHQHTPSNLSSTLDAERADRISRLAGLERVTTARNNPNQSGSHLAPNQTTPVQSYFDAGGNPAIARERSTVGSASATGSVGARTTWAGSEGGDTTSNFDKMSESTREDMDMDTSSVGGMSEEGTPSLVAFGEGARTPARHSTYGTPARTPRAYEPEGMDGVVSGGGAAAAERIVRENMNTTSQDRMDGHNEGSPTRGSGPELGKFGFEK